MATQQAYNAYMQNKGTLVPGQSIVVNKYSVQVERYLSQGGFAHVYLVRTATPVYNTTHHVLKRIAVANEAMLKEVKKEVDVMRLLKGHPNIVHLIDAAWQQTPNGMYEVFILMEFCPGGGIIDMMNRRLRERLTEAEILQIFVDVCEGVAYMHNLRPALLHRDLKVENILQSTSTSYKLCDFGSATTVSRPPASTQEIRALEADLNRHTTLQYRAPEMVDVYSRRPVDEKSDVWALGVLLYKLCYYTTPFEEHGQLAILNVQYKIPPYPVYSNQMNQLIASMLQEHGVRRPSVFEILSHVHRLRGTKSRFKYTIPVIQPLSPRQPIASQSSPSPTVVRNDLMTVPQPNKVTMSVSPSRGQGVEAREKVMEAIAPLRKAASYTELGAPTVSANLHEPPDSPMRRGRPLTKESVPLAAKPKMSENGYGKSLLSGGVSAREEQQNTNTPRGEGSSVDAWNVGGKVPRISGNKDTTIGFGDDFSSKLWDGVGEKASSQGRPSLPSSKPSSPLPTRLQPPLVVNRRPSPDKDAFEGLGLALAPEKPAPTLAEARKLRTGLAIMHNNGFRTNPERFSGSTSSLSPSPRQPFTSNFQLYPSPVTASIPEISKVPSPKLTQTSSSKAPASQPNGNSAETRFPSLEELDSGFQLSLPPPSHSRTPSVQSREDSVSLTRRNGVSVRPGAASAALLKPDSRSRHHAREGTRSEQVTGVAMRDSEAIGGTNRSDFKPSAVSSLRETKAASLQPSQSGSDFSSRPGLAPKHGNFSAAEVNLPNTSELSHKSNPASRAVEDMVQRSPMLRKPRDWLTGDDDADNDDASPTSLLLSSPLGETLVVRDSPSKRASLIESSPILVHAGVIAQHDHTEPVSPPAPDISPTLSKFTRSFPPIDGLDAPQKGALSKHSPVLEPTLGRPLGDESASSGDEGPEDAIGIVPPTRAIPSERKGHKGRQSSVHDLVDLYGGGVSQKEKERDTRGSRPSTLELDSASPGQKGRPSLASVPTNLKSTKPLSSSPSVASKTLLVPVSTSTTNTSSLPIDTEHATPTSAPTPSPSRSRPQSMILFPSSRSTDSYSLSNGQQPVSPGLVPPEGARQRNARRTSITDIVQRYEDIGGQSKPIGKSGPLSPTTPRPVAAIKLPGLASTDTRSTKRPEKVPTTGLSVPMGDYVPSRRPKSPTDSKVSSPAAISRPVPIRHHTLNKDLDGIPRNTPSKPEVVRVSKFPTPSTADDTLSRTESGTSSSPERPYQGVGKLIDQWQKKSAEAETSKTMVRGRSTFTAK